MTWGVAAAWLAAGLGGGALAGGVACELRLEERVALATVCGVVLGALATLGLTLVAGLSAATAVTGPLLLLLAVPVVLLLRRRGPGPLASWRASLDDARARVRARDPEPWLMLGVAAVALGVFGYLFARTLYGRDGSIVAGYPTVWADWSLHSTLASSFVHAANLPPHDPLFSGGALRYPFLPDFHAATLQVAGAGLGGSLAVPGVVLCTATTVLVVSLARRLAGSIAVGVVAMLLCVAGGGLGFTGVWWDACHAAGRDDAACQPLAQVIRPGVAAAVLGEVPHVVASQSASTRAYDNLQNADSQQLGDIQWYTPLYAWWLPQRTFVYGFAVGCSVLLLVVAGRRAPAPARSPFLVAGLLAGSLPLVHVHTLIALAIVLPLLALGSRRREWLHLAVAGLALALPRVVAVAAQGHGTGAGCAGGGSGGGGTGTAFPFLEPGWMHTRPAAFDAVACSRPGRFDVTVLGALRSLPSILGTALDPGFWWFWVVNNGIAVVIALGLALAVGLRALPRLLRRLPLGRAPTTPTPGPVMTAARWGAATAGSVPRDLLGFCVPFVAVFAVSNVVVFQTWDWDNTKLLAWWYLGAALLTAAVLVRLAGRGALRAVVAGLALLSLVAGACLNIARYHAMAGGPGAVIPYTWASPSDQLLAAQVEAAVPPHAVVLTRGEATDPVLTLAGRTAVTGYSGWLYSYGVDTGTRPRDSRTMLAGCDAVARCEIPALLHRYDVSFVEMCDDGANPDCAGSSWYARHFPVVAAVPGTAVYDVRGA